MRTIRNIDTGPVSPLLVAAALALVLAALLPAPGRGDELVAEAAFIPDTLPPDGRQVQLSIDAASPAPRGQLALALGPSVGLTAEVGVHRFEGRLAADTPSASLKLAAREAAPGRTGVSFSLDFFGSAHSMEQNEAGGGVGLVRLVGPVTLRAAAWGATGVATWSPHAHAGLSAAFPLGPRTRILAEVVSEVAPREHGAALAAGPTVKFALDERTSFSAGALLPATASARPLSVSFALARSL